MPIALLSKPGMSDALKLGKSENFGCRNRNRDRSRYYRNPKFGKNSHTEDTRNAEFFTATGILRRLRGCFNIPIFLRLAFKISELGFFPE